MHVPQIAIEQEAKLVRDRLCLSFVLAVDFALRLLFVYRQSYHHAIVIVLLRDLGRAASVQGELLIYAVEILNKGLRRLVGLNHNLDVWSGELGTAVPEHN